MDTIREADYFSMQVSNKAGQGVRLLGAIASIREKIAATGVK